MACTHAAPFQQLLIVSNRRNHICNAFQVRCRSSRLFLGKRISCSASIKQRMMAKRICMEPPKKDSKPTQENIQKLEQWLTSIIAGHPGATHSYTFYEEIDKYLGPWGEDGYPIGYGKKYNILFTTDHNLRTNTNVQNWVWKTTIKLQEKLRGYIVQAYREGNLKPDRYTSSEFKEELKEAAFKSHSKAYASGGLTIVAMLSPDALLKIGRIPRTELSPLSPDFKASVQQVLDTIEKVIPEMAGVAMATLAGPAHTRSFQRAHHMDMNTAWGKMQIIDSLNWLKGAIRRRELDAPPILDEIIRRLNAGEFPDMGTAKLAREVIKAAGREKKLYLTPMDVKWQTIRRCGFFIINALKDGSDNEIQKLENHRFIIAVRHGIDLLCPFKHPSEKSQRCCGSRRCRSRQTIYRPGSRS
jgi:hypothetical protein